MEVIVIFLVGYILGAYLLHQYLTIKLTNYVKVYKSHIFDFYLLHTFMCVVIIAILIPFVEVR